MCFAVNLLLISKSNFISIVRITFVLINGICLKIVNELLPKASMLGFLAGTLVMKTLDGKVLRDGNGTLPLTVAKG